MLEQKNRAQAKPDMQEFFFNLAQFNFSLKNINESVAKLKKLIIKYTGASGATLMFLDKYGYLWKAGEKTTFSFKVGVGIAGKAASAKKILYVQDIMHDERYKVLNKKVSASMVSIPIIKNGQVLGVLNLTYSKTSRKNFPPEKVLLKIFAEKLKTILENIIQLHLVSIERNELKTRKDINRIMEKEEPLKKKLGEIRRKIIAFTNVEDAGFLFTDPESLHSIQAAHKITGKKFQEIQLANELAEFFKSKKYKSHHGFFDVSANHAAHIRDSKAFATAYPIFSNNRLNGFILVEDNIKNIDNLSTQEKNLIRLTSMRIGKYLDREHFSKKIIEEKERWRLIFHNVNDGIILISQDKKIIEANPKAQEILGSKKQSLTNQNLFSLFKIIHSNITSETLSSIKNISHFKRASEYELEKKIDRFFKLGQNIRPKEYYIETKNGRFWIAFSMNTALRRWEEAVFGVVHIRDITKRKELEQDKNEFMSMVSHELRTPLSAMKGFLSMILANDYGELNEQQVRSLSRIAESNSRMVCLVEDILDVSRIELGRVNFRKEAVNVSELVHNIVQDLDLKIKEKKIKVKISNNTVKIPSKERAAKAPADHGRQLDIYAFADRDRMAQIMQNLIDNAIKYTFQAGNLEIKIQASGKFAEIKIIDDGVGISKEDQGKLFQRFSRIHNPLSIQAGGTGLGLYITKKLVLAQKGKIEVKSAPGKGTAFSVKIPIAKQLPLI